MAAAGMLDKQIGTELGLSLNTLRTYWQRTRAKVGDESKTALVGMFVKENLRSKETDDLDLLPHEGVIFDVEKGLILADDAVNDMHGLEHGKWHPFVEYSHIYHPDDRDAARKIIYDVLEGRLDTANVIFRLVPESGVEVINVTLLAVRGEDGKVKRVYGYRVRALDCRPGHDPEVRLGQWERWSDSDQFTIDAGLAAILGLPGGGVYPRSVIIERLHPDDRENMATYVQRAVEAGQTQAQTDTRALSSDGVWYWVRTKARIIPQSDGRYHILGTAAVFR